MTASSCCFTSSCAVTLRLRQGQCLMPGGVILLTRCEPTDVCVRVCRTSSRPHDRTPVPAKPWGQSPSNFEQVQHMKNWERYSPESRCHMAEYSQIRIRYIMEYLYP